MPLATVLESSQQPHLLILNHTYSNYLHSLNLTLLAMFVSSFAVLALALSAFAAPLGASPKTTGGNPQVHDVATTNGPHVQVSAVSNNLLPTITSPHAGAVWTDGQTYSVSWSKHNPCHSLSVVYRSASLERLAIPDELKEKTGTLLLGPASGQPDSGTLPWLSDPTYMPGD